VSRHEHWRIEALNAVSEQRSRHATARRGIPNAYRDQLQQADGPDQNKLECVPKKQQHEQVQPARTTGFNLGSAIDPRRVLMASITMAVGMNRRKKK
jgi:hypothetical protein